MEIVMGGDVLKFKSNISCGIRLLNEQISAVIGLRMWWCDWDFGRKKN